MFDGQSLNVLPTTGAFPGLVAAELERPFVNVAIGGVSWSDLAPTAEYRLHVHARSHVGALLVLTGGTSDIYNADDNDTGAQALADMEAYADTARTAGFGTIVASTVPPSSFLDADDETQRGILNAGIRTSAHWEAVADLAADPSLADNLDTTYYSDGSHFTATGAAVAASVVADAIATLT